MADLTYKFCIISYVAGSRGAFLGYQLFTQYPELFSIESPPYKNGPMIIENYDTWHTYGPYFSAEILESHPRLTLKNIFDSPSAEKLDKEKYNIILTHHYNNDELQPLRQVLEGHTVVTLQITFDSQSQQEIFYRSFAAATKFGHNTDTSWQNSHRRTIENSCLANNTIPVPLAILKDHSNPPDLTNILENFFGCFRKKIVPNCSARRSKRSLCATQVSSKRPRLMQFV